MIFYFNAIGESIGMTPEKVFQGSKKVNAVTMVGAVQSVNVVSATFEYNDGLDTEEVVLALDENFSACNLTDEFGNGYTAWTCDLPAVVSAKAGMVSVQFFITTPTDEVLSTATVRFEVEDGVDYSEPPATETYESVLAAIAALKAQVDNMSVGGSSGSGLTLYKYTVNGTFMDYANSTSFVINNMTFISYENVEITSNNLFTALSNCIRITGGSIDDASLGHSYGKFVPFTVGSGYGINAIAVLNQDSLTLEYRIFEQIQVTSYSVQTL